MSGAIELLVRGCDSADIDQRVSSSFVADDPLAVQLGGTAAEETAPASQIDWREEGTGEFDPGAFDPLAAQPAAQLVAQPLTQPGAQPAATLITLQIHGSLSDGAGKPLGAALKSNTALTELKLETRLSPAVAKALRGGA